MIRISAIVCTYKRPDYLRQALESLNDQTLLHDEYEIIVVDNGVQIETQQVVENFRDGRLNLRYVPEPVVGLSRARNTGLNAAAARYVAFLDDDARAAPGWLEALVNAFEQTSPKPAAVGGPVSLDWQGEKPSWVPERHLSLYTCVDHGLQSRLLDKGEYLVGANLAFDKAQLLSLGGFDAKLGRQGTVLLSGEEAAILSQLRRNGFPIFYEATATVSHSVDKSRRRPGWLLKRLFWDGASQALIDRSGRDGSRRSASLSAYRDLRQCAGWTLGVLGAVVRGRKGSAWESLLGLSQRAGRLRTEVRLLASGSD
ncbi:MAG TPA: glycosyltransferase [Pyrinomonadaceae bacterium]|jgi:glycosyltransferase involved in cell wall biosynthesis